MRSSHSCLELALASALLLGCTSSVEIDAPDIEITQPNLQFPAAPAHAAAGTSVQGQFKFATNKLGAANSPDAGSLKKLERLSITRVILKAHTGIQDFGFLDHLTVAAANNYYATESSPDWPVLQILDYQASPDVQTGAVLQLPLDTPVNMLPLWGHTSLYITVTATGDPPTFPWSVDVVFSLSLKLHE
jgi:hypothetical protein